jgi:hypothetical protein
MMRSTRLKPTGNYIAAQYLPNKRAAKKIDNLAYQCNAYVTEQWESNVPAYHVELLAWFDTVEAMDAFLTKAHCCKTLIKACKE